MGLSQSALARRVGISPQAIQALESGAAAGSRHLAMIAGVLGVEAIWLLKGESEPIRADYVEMTSPLQAEDPISGIVPVSETDTAFPPIQIKFDADTIPIFICESIQNSRMPKSFKSAIRDKHLFWLSESNKKMYSVYPDEIDRISTYGVFYAISDVPDDHIRRPHYLEGQLGAYAVYINESVHISEQTINHSIAFVSPYKRPDFGNHVIIWFHDNTFVTGMMFDENPDNICLFSYALNEAIYDDALMEKLTGIHPLLDISKKHVRAIHTVTGLEFTRPRSPRVKFRGPIKHMEELQERL